MQCPYCGEMHSSGTFLCPTTQNRLSGIVPTGQVIDGKYKIMKVLGTGGMAAVYRAEHQKIGRVVALKLLLPEYVANPELVARVEREARAAGSIDHPNVVAVMDLGSTPEFGPYIAMELLKGEELGAEVHRHGGRLPVERAVDIVRQVLSALEAAHEKGVVHRDLKPENIYMVRADDDRTIVKVLDFGISKVAAEHGKVSSLTRTGTVMGTPQFMAPEQAAGAKDQDARVDIYAVGVVLYELLTGARPYDAENYNLLINQILNQPPVPILDQDPDLDPTLASIVMKAIARRPQDRFANARAMLDALVGWMSAQNMPIGRANSSPALAATMMAPTPTMSGNKRAGSRPATPPVPTGVGPGADPRASTTRASRPRPASGAADPTAIPAAEVIDVDIAPTSGPAGRERNTTRTPLGWENTPRGVPTTRRNGRTLVGVLAVLGLLGAGVFAIRALKPGIWNDGVGRMGLSRLAVADPDAAPTPAVPADPHHHGLPGGNAAAHGGGTPSAPNAAPTSPVQPSNATQDDDSDETEQHAAPHSRVRRPVRAAHRNAARGAHRRRR